MALLAAAPPAAADAAEDLDAAAEQLTLFNFENSYEGFQAVRATLAEEPGGPAWQRATLGQALAAQARTPATAALIAEADGLYEALAREAPDSPLTPRALLQRGRLLELRDHGGDVIDLGGARGFYRQVFEGWPDLDIADEAALRFADTRVQEFQEPGSVEEGVAFLEGWVGGRSDRPLAPVIWEFLSRVKHHYLGDLAGSLAAFEKADALGLVDDTAAGSEYWRVGRIAERLGRLEQAIGYYRRIILEEARSGRAFHAQLALQRLREEHPGMNIDVPETPSFLGGNAEDAGASESAARTKGSTS